MKLKNRLTAVVVTFTLGFVTFGFIAERTIEELRINGPLYKQIVQDKDLVADILPPPAYIVESYLVVLQMYAGRNNTQLPKMIDRLNALETEYNQRQQFWNNQKLDANMKRVFLDDSKKSAQEFYSIVKSEFIPAIKSENKDAAAVVLEKLEQSYTTHRNAINQTVEMSLALQHEDERVADTTIRNDYIVLFVVFLLSVGSAAGLAIFTSRKILNQIGGEPDEAKLLANRIAKGDLTGEINPNADPQSLIGTFRIMQETLRSLIDSIAKNSTRLASAAEELSAVTKESSVAYGKQLAQANAMTTSIQHMAEVSQDVSGSSAQAADAAGAAKVDSLAGADAITRMRQSIDVLVNDVTDASQVIQRLAEAGDKIGTVVDVINGIAEQTNLLALNAAIEAARAGEQGRGFAVVADEVRTLASRTKDSTKEIHDMMQQLQTGTRHAVEVMQLGTEHAQASKLEIQDAETTLKNITVAVSTVTDMNSQIAHAAKEQRSVTQTVSENLSEILSITDGVSKNSDNTADATADLAKLASELQSIIQQFRIAS